MIKINLLGNNTALDNSGRLVIVGAVSTSIFTILLFILVVAQLSSRHSSLELEAKTLEGKLENLVLKTKGVVELEAKKKVLQNKLSVIAELKKSTVGPVRVLDDLNLATGDKVWLAEVQEESSNFKVRGKSLSNQDIASFIKKLEESDYFEDVNLIESRSMYYDKETGEIKAARDLTSIGGGTDSVGASKINRAETLVIGNDETKEDINIKEFIISARVKYTGVYDILPAIVPITPIVAATKKKRSGEAKEGL